MRPSPLPAQRIVERFVAGDGDRVLEVREGSAATSVTLAAGGSWRVSELSDLVGIGLSPGYRLFTMASAVTDAVDPIRGFALIGDAIHPLADDGELIEVIHTVRPDPAEAALLIAWFAAPDERRLPVVDPDPDDPSYRRVHPRGLRVHRNGGQWTVTVLMRTWPGDERAALTPDPEPWIEEWTVVLADADVRWSRARS